MSKPLHSEFKINLTDAGLEPKTVLWQIAIAIRRMMKDADAKGLNTKWWHLHGILVARDPNEPVEEPEPEPEAPDVREIVAETIRAMGDAERWYTYDDVHYCTGSDDYMNVDELASAIIAALTDAGVL